MSNRSHFVTTIQMRAAYLSDAAQASGEGNIAIAMLRSGMPATGTQDVAIAELGVTR